MQKNIEKNSKVYEVIDLSNQKRWDEIVKSFRNYDVFYLSDYVKAFKNDSYLFYYNDGITKAINVFDKKDIAKDKKMIGKIPQNTYFDISTPYGYGGFITEKIKDAKDIKNVNDIKEAENIENTKNTSIEMINNKFQEYCINNNIISEFVRFSLFNEYRDNYYGEVVETKPNIVRKINTNPTDMLKEFEHKVRKNLKRASLNNLKIDIDKEAKTLDNFLEIYYSTMDRNNAKKEYYFSKDFFDKICSMKDNAAIFNVIYENKIISTELVIYSSKNCYSFLGGTLSDYFILRPNDFLKYEIIKWAYENKIENFILGGGYTNQLDDGILKYKRSFAPKDGIKHFYIGKKIFNEKVYNELVKLRKGDVLDEKYFPIYRS